MSSLAYAPPTNCSFSSSARPPCCLERLLFDGAAAAGLMPSLGPVAPEEEAVWAAELRLEAVAGSELAVLLEAQDSWARR